MLGDCAGRRNVAAVVEDRFEPKLDGLLGVVDGLVESVPAEKQPGRSGTATP
jgi:hypothetical protein